MDRQINPIARLGIAVLLFFHLSGCQIIIGTLLTLQGRPKETCEFTKMTHGKKLTEDGKRTIVLSCSGGAAQLSEPSLDCDVISEVSRCLQNDHVDVVNPHRVNTWIDDNGGINEGTDLEPIGEKFAADYIILFKFDDFGYSEWNSPGLFQGHAKYRVVVVEMVPSKKDKEKRQAKDTREGPNDDVVLKPSKKDKGTRQAKIIYNRPFDFKYPENRQKPAEDVGDPDMFKSEYKAQLARKLARLFIDYRPEDDMN